ncbi:DNA/RNA helicase, superfamily II, SNF2 family [Beggiatoa alba B18LD]|uniref:DNA/RNA helicase, superfamily II, SNF2 family n=1 Tax=Beggiatoa alba B18LD TaxID=395493 RepID=I3CF51_9GAMM|nr:DEAD/DEAH box helicase [Beggiatoa alba]EIJ42244.1 DNA/RNA helicase, superfamily II, SNF2 family [Beggiatoa alba B18LD]
MFFRKPKKKIPPTQFKWVLDNAEICLQLLQGETLLPLDSWMQKTGQQSFAGVSFLLGELEIQADWDEAQRTLFVLDNNTLKTKADWVARLAPYQAIWLNLPAPVPFILDIDHEGTLDQEKFRFQYQWLRENGQPLVMPKQVGALLQVGSQVYRLAEPHFSLIQGMEVFNATPPQAMDDRFLAWGKLSEFLPEDSVQAIQTHGYLQKTKIAHACSFTLDIQEENGEFVFDPVFIKTKPNHDPNTADFSIEPEALLTDIYKETFKQRFKESQQARSRYVLQEGWYVVVDEPLRQALEVVHRFQKTDHATRREFAKNPRAYLRGVLGDNLNEEVLESLFVETREYSQRVTEIGLWEAKVLPLAQLASETWLPPQANPARRARPKEEDTEELTLTTSEEEEDKNRRITLKIDDNLHALNYVKQDWQPREPALPLQAPSALKSTLKPHQESGLQWMQQHWNSGSSGCLLADDMGLGKTLQSLTFMVWLKESMRAGLAENLPILIVAPTGLLKNWEQEHQIHFNMPALGQLLRAYGQDLRDLRTTQGSELSKGLPLLDKERLQQADWLLTTYETLRDYQHSFAGLHFSAIIFDEVQKIKTPGTLMTEAAKAMHTEFILAMTGTPIENRLSDLWCIIDTVCPGYLGDLKQFSAYYEKDRDNMYELKAYLTQTPNEHTPPIMLRRMKEDHLTGFPELAVHLLPENQQTGSMPPLQAESYAGIIRQQVEGEAKAGAVLEALQQLRSISLHPYSPIEWESLLEAEKAEAPPVIETPPETTVADSPDALLQQDTAYIQQSARLSTTFALLDEIQAKQEKVLIFLESQYMQRYLMGLIYRRYGINPMLINGSVNGQKRQERVNQFQKAEGFDVFIISPLAGGVGLTLTAANHVIHLTRWWNPAVEDQCTCRAYRIGQTKTVHVYYPLAIHPEFKEHSFDWRLHNLLDNKRALSRDMLLPPIAQEQDIQQLYEDIVHVSEQEERELMERPQAV